MSLFTPADVISRNHRSVSRKTNLAFVRDAAVNQDMDRDWCETDL